MVTPLVTCYLVLVGLLMGSFINLAVDRLPRGESIVRPRSHCRACRRVLNTVDLLPVAGYLVRRGRCATCGTPIGLSSPVVEALSGACVMGPIVWLGPWPGGLIGLALLALFATTMIGIALRRRTRAEARA